MSLNPHGPVEAPPADYVKSMGPDSDEQRAIARAILRANGCRSVRFVVRGNGALDAHGWIATVQAAEVEVL